MSIFRPAARVTAPDGREWEIYAYKLRTNERDPWTVDEPLVEDARVWLVTGIVWVLGLVPRLLLRLYDLARAGVRSVRSDDWTIEAVSWVPSETRFTWSTTTEHKGQVLAQVEGHLARGDLPLRLTNAVYRGESRSAR